MATTVISAFREFQTAIDLAASVSDSAKNSRNYLQTQIRNTMANDGIFPTMEGSFIQYGSFARKTKIKPLNDVDFMVKLDGQGASIVSTDLPYIHRIQIDDTNSPLYRFKDITGSYVSSIRVLNAMKLSIQTHASYNRSVVVRNQQAVIVNLTSYDWSFDVVPALGVTLLNDKTDYYLIPDGKGNWMQTDPRKDAAQTSGINQKHESKLLSVIRMLKHWNRRGGKTRMNSFHFETLVLKVFEFAPTITTQRAAIKYFFNSAQFHLQHFCPSPTGFGPNLDSYLTDDDREGIIAAMRRASQSIALAERFSELNDQKSVIDCWRMVFGAPFPAYG